jgi:hypothetical protein
VTIYLFEKKHPAFGRLQCKHNVKYLPVMPSKTAGTDMIYIVTTLEQGIQHGSAPWI